MPIPFDDSVARVRGAMTSDTYGDELIAAIANASALSTEAAKRFDIACTSSGISRHIQNAILGLVPLSQLDLAVFQEMLTSTDVGLSYAQKVAGGLKDKYGNVSYPSVPTAQVATPTFSPVAGSYTGTQSVTVSCATDSAAMYYTTNGSTPTTASTLYTGPISVAASETVKVLAVKSGFINSAIASAAYVIS